MPKFISSYCTYTYSVNYTETEQKFVVDCVWIEKGSFVPVAVTYIVRRLDVAHASL